jgi:hypothetical protein
MKEEEEEEDKEDEEEEEKVEEGEEEREKRETMENRERRRRRKSRLKRRNRKGEYVGGRNEEEEKERERERPDSEAYRTRRPLGSCSAPWSGGACSMREDTECVLRKIAFQSCGVRLPWRTGAAHQCDTPDQPAQRDNMAFFSPGHHSAFDVLGPTGDYLVLWCNGLHSGL